MPIVAKISQLLTEMQNTVNSSPVGLTREFKSREVAQAPIYVID